MPHVVGGRSGRMSGTTKWSETGKTGKIG
jgi:hypothetical protein